MQVRLDELDELWDKLMSHMKELNIQQIELEEDYYWNIPYPEYFDVYNKPDEYTVGQLTDDWGGLHKVIGGQVEPVVYHLVQLAAVLRVIGEKGESELMKRVSCH